MAAKGNEQFADMFCEVRNGYIIAGISPLINMRVELIADSSLMLRNGMDTTTRNHYTQHLANCDRIRRNITFNPENKDLQTLVDEAKDTKKKIATPENPIAGDSIKLGSVSLKPLPWKFDGSDPNVPLNSQLEGKKVYSPNGLLLIGMIDETIVAWTRLESRNRSKFIYATDSLRIYTAYQGILTYLQNFAGDENFVDFAQTPPSEEPQGVNSATNRLNEVTGRSELPTT